MNVFVNPVDGRPRAGWRILIFVVIFIMILASMSLVIGIFEQPSWISQLVTGIGALLALWFGSLIVDRKPFADFGFNLSPQWWLQLARGMAWGIGLIAVLTGLAFMLGYAEVEQVIGWQESIWTVFVTMIGVSIAEEVIFRGYIQHNLEEGLDYWGKQNAVVISILIVSIGFSLAHAGNPNLTVLALVNISLAGILLGYSYVVTRSLAWPLGFHLTWNWFQGGFLGVNVSGLEMSGYTDIALSGPAWLTGGNFGFEGGVLCSVILIIATFSLHKIYGPVTYPESHIIQSENQDEFEQEKDIF